MLANSGSSIRPPRLVSHASEYVHAEHCIIDCPIIICRRSFMCEKV